MGTKATGPSTTAFDAAGRRVLAVCMAAGFTTLLDQSVLNIALPDIRAALHADPAQLGWLVAGYSLAFGLALIPGGRLGDLYGRKWLFVGGLALVTAAAALAGTAHSADLLVAARLLQGVGAGCVNAQMIGTLQDVFTGTARARALGLYVLTGGLSTALGPPVGGLLLAAAGPGLGWRLTVLLSTPFGLAALLLAVRYLPPPRPAARRSRPDLPGLALVAALTLLVMLPAIRPPRLAAGLLYAGGALLAVLLLTAWQRHQTRRGGDPLIHPALTRSRPFQLGTVIAMAQFATSMAASLVQTMFLREGLGLSALAAAAVALPAALAMAATSAQAGRVVQRLGRHAVTTGLALLTGALLGAALAAVLLPAGPLPYVLAVTQLVQGVSTGLIVAPNQAFTLGQAPAEAAGVAGGLLQMSQRIAAAVGIAAVSGLYLRGSAGPGAAHRTAYVDSLLALAAVAALALLLSALAAHREAGPTAMAPVAPAHRPSGTTVR
ncbi:MFS transporter [Kitasatospora sp. NPDC049285]|uniref:MFS transporter n=1 Tax=Kitasatospora sp. NPDC049285 TaxID=3157096 RepID=UPI003442CB4A